MTDEPEDRDEELDPSEYVMPVVPAELGIDPLLLAIVHCAAFLDFAEEALVEPDAAGDALEHIGLYVQRLAPERVTALTADLERLVSHAEAESWPTPMLEFVTDFLYSCGIGDERDDDEPS